MSGFELTPTRPPKQYIPKNDKPELSIHRRVASYLRKHYPYVDFNSDFAANVQLTPYQAKLRASLQSGRGWPDIMIAYPMTHTREDKSEVTYHGLALELKKEGTSIYCKIGPRKGKLVQTAQIVIEAAVLARLTKLGYCARFAVGYDQAIRIIEWYFNQPDNASLF